MPLILSILSLTAALPDEPPPMLAKAAAASAAPPIVKKSPILCVAANADEFILEPYNNILPSSNEAKGIEFGTTMPAEAAASASIMPSYCAILSRAGIESCVAK